VAAADSDVIETPSGELEETQVTDEAAKGADK
jgi:hypothetical protein